MGKINKIGIMYVSIITFNQLIQSEIRLYKQHIQKGDIYKPYKYY